MQKESTSTKGSRIAAHRKDWQKSLEQIRGAGIKYCPNLPAMSQRWNNWWQFKADAPLIMGQVAKTRDIRWDRGFDLFDQPQEWVRMRRQQVEQTHYFGETLPWVRVDIGPVAIAAFMGTPVHLAEIEQTSWQTPVIDSWENLKPLQVDPDNEWLKKVLRLMDALAEDARGEYLVCLPDLAGAMDALANMRGTQKLCFDLYENQDAVLRAAAQAVDAWELVFSQMYDLVLGHGTGITQWLSCWSDSPFTVPTCDFNALIGPDDFKTMCMPSLKDQAHRAGLCLIHVDGPDAARHAETLAEDPDITAIQYTPGAGTPSLLAKLPMLKMIQKHNVPLFLTDCPFEEAKQLAQELDPRGCAIRVDLKTKEQGDDLIQWRDKTFA